MKPHLSFKAFATFWHFSSYLHLLHPYVELPLQVWGCKKCGCKRGGSFGEKKKVKRFLVFLPASTSSPTLTTTSKNANGKFSSRLRFARLRPNPLLRPTYLLMQMYLLRQDPLEMYIINLRPSHKTAEKFSSTMWILKKYCLCNYIVSCFASFVGFEVPPQKNESQVKTLHSRKFTT